MTPNHATTTQTRHDVDGMARYMLELARDEPLPRRRMGQAGRRRMQQHVDTPNQIAKLEDVLLDCIRRHRPRRTFI